MNPNTFYAETFVDALARAGLEAVCIAPGSRSTPLTLAFAKHDGIKKYTHLDERSAAFFALGMAMASDKPVAMVCTSGTAAANFFPAIIEANMSRVPLLVLTADRPHELRHSGANQTIDQVKLYGDHVLWSVDMALPEANPPAVAVRNLRTMAARAMATANGQMAFRRKGVVHLNFPFRKPLEPSNLGKDAVKFGFDIHNPILMNRETIETGELELSFSQVNEFLYLIENYRDGIIVCGTGHRSQSVIDLGHITGYPIFADPLSSTRYSGTSDNVISTYETFLQCNEPLQDIDVVIRFGAVPISKWLNQYIADHRPKQYIHVDSAGVWADDAQMVDWYITAPEYVLSEFIYGELRRDNSAQLAKNALGEEFTKLNEVTISVIERNITNIFFDAAAIYKLWEHLPSGSTAFVGNSNAIRHIDQFIPSSEKVVGVYASRGASGIDGQISTALGIGAATGEHVYAIIGDITFYHDMNGLLAIQRNGVTATIIVINNDGGGIFERLPIREHEPYYTDYFTTPHGLTFEHAAKLYGLEYAFADDFESLDTALDKYINADVSSIIEVKTDIETDEARRKEIIEIVNQRIREELGTQSDQEQ